MKEQAAFNLVYKWFQGLGVEKLPPKFSPLCRFRARLGTESFEKLLKKMVEQALSRDVITDRLHFSDSNHIVALVDLFRLKKALKGKEGGDDNHYVVRHCANPGRAFWTQEQQEDLQSFDQRL